MFSCEFFEVSQKTFFTEHLRATASVKEKFNSHSCISSSINPFFPNYILSISENMFSVGSKRVYWEHVGQLTFCIFLRRSLTSTSDQDHSRLCTFCKLKLPCHFKATKASTTCCSLRQLLYMRGLNLSKLVMKQISP